MSLGDKPSVFDKLLASTDKSSIGKSSKSNPFKSSSKDSSTSKGLAKKILPTQDIALVPVSFNTPQGPVTGFRMMPIPKEEKAGAQNPTKKPGSSSYASQLFKPGNLKI